MGFPRGTEEQAGELVLNSKLYCFQSEPDVLPEAPASSAHGPVTRLALAWRHALVPLGGEMKLRAVRLCRDARSAREQSLTAARRGCTGGHNQSKPKHRPAISITHVHGLGTSMHVRVVQ
jgi:hypothetical protein